MNACLAAAQRQGPAERTEERLGDHLAPMSVGGVEQHGELVAAEPRRGVCRAHRALHAATDLGEHLVADRVTECVVDRLEVVEIEEQHGGLPVAARHSGFDPLGEEGAVRQPREDVVERLVAQPLLQIRHLGQRALEPSVLEHHARVADERLEQALVVAAEGDDVPGAVADDDQAEDAVLAAKRCDDRVRQLACGEVAVERVRRPGRGEQDRVRPGSERREHLRVGGAHDVGVGVHLALRAERAPQPLLGPDRAQEDLGVLGPDELPGRDEQLADREAELGRSLRGLHRRVEELEMVVALRLVREGADRGDPDRDRQHEQHERAAVLAGELDRDQHHRRDADRRDDRDSRRERQPPGLEAALGNPDRDRDEQDADEGGGNGSEDGADPAGDPECVALPGDRPEHDHRDGCRERELGEVEDELGGTLAADDSERRCRPDELRHEQAAGREQVEAEDEPDLAERDRVRLPAHLHVDDVRLGEVEDERQRPPGHRAGDQRLRVEAPHDVAPERDSGGDEDGVVDPDRRNAEDAPPGA